MTQPTERDRADFEAWISKPPFEYSTAKFGNGEYVYATVGFAWKAWQEAQAKMQARVAELEKREAAYDIILKVVSSALERAGVTECDNPGDAIEMLAQERDNLKSICENVPEGCTPADARVLREANHALVDEVAQAKWHKGIAEAALLSVEKERDQLLISLGKPEEITYPPHEDYDCLKKQYLALRSLANGRCRMASHWSSQCEKMTRDLLLTKGGIIDAERNTNAMLTDQLLQAEQERDGLAAKLAHLESLSADELLRPVVLLEDVQIGPSDKALAKLKADAVREACDKVVSNYRMVSFDKNENLYLNVAALRDYAGQIEREGGV